MVLVPEFKSRAVKLELQVVLRGQSASTLNNYIRRIALFVIHFETITLHRVEATLSKFFQKMANMDLLIIDDFGVKVMDGQQLLDFMELIEDRHGRKATIIMSQLAVADWYNVMLSNTTAADAILNRMVHTAYRFELKGDTMRKTKN